MMADYREPASARRRPKASAPADARTIVPPKPPEALHEEHSAHAVVSPEFRSEFLNVPDAELVQRSIAQDAEAYGELVCRYQADVRGLARSIVRDFQTAEDLSQDAFIKGFHSLADLKEPSKFNSWICTILRHTALDYLRSHRNMKSLESLQEEGFEPKEVAEQTVATELLEVHEDEVRTVHALSKLREDYREIIILKHVQKLSYKEIAKRLNMSVSAVGEKLSRVRSLLKRKLEKKQFREGEDELNMSDDSRDEESGASQRERQDERS